MSTPTFYHQSLSKRDESVVLSSTESSHAANARRMRVGQAVHLFNGEGLIADGEISHLERREVNVRVTGFKEVEKPNTQLTIATAVPKGDRQRVLIDMLTQLGVTRIVPIVYEFSVSQFNDKVSVKWQRYIIEACKQSRNPWLPMIGQAEPVVDFVESCDDGLMAADAQGESMQGLLNDHIRDQASATILIGPEGGFSASEYAILSQNKVKYVKIGPYILRTEAAAVVAASQWVQFVRTRSSS